MQCEVRRLVAMVAVCVLGLAAMASAQQQTTKVTENKQFEIISVEGNTLVVKGPEGTRELTVPEDFLFTVNGKPMSVHDLKPGMKGTAKVTTTTTVKPVYVTEIRNGEVVQGGGGSILIRGPKGFQNVTQGDVDKRNIKIYKDGKPVQISELHTGDRLTATVVTSGKPEIMTTRQVEATLANDPVALKAATAAAAAHPTTEKSTGSAAKSTRAAESPAAAAGTAGSAGGGAARRRTLPKTGSDLPLVGFAGLAMLAIALGLTARRRATR